MHVLHKQLIGIKWGNKIELVFHFTTLMLHVTIASFEYHQETQHKR